MTRVNIEFNFERSVKQISTNQHRTFENFKRAFIHETVDVESPRRLSWKTGSPFAEGNKMAVRNARECISVLCYTIHVSANNNTSP